MAKVTIEDISKKTGLSRGTISRALNDRPDISPQTKDRVLQACRELNYTPSYAARSLATGRTYSVAVLVDDLRNAYAASVLRGIVSRADEASYAVHVMELGDSDENLASRLEAFTTERIDGVLINTPLSDDRARQIGDALGRAAAVALCEVNGLPCDVFVVDLPECGRLAANFVFEKNRQPRYVYVHGTADAEQRVHGFRDACGSRGVDAGGLITALPTDVSTSALTEFVRSVSVGDVLIADDDELAVNLMLACGRVGRAVGAETPVIGQGNTRLSETVRPTLTTIDWNGAELGRRAMDTVLARINRSRMDAPQTTRVAPQLVERESTAAL